MDIKETIVWLLYRVVASPFRLFPIKKKRIVFEAYYGRGFQDSPSVIATELAKRNIDGLEMIWFIRSKEDAKSLPSYICPARRFSLKELLHLSTARIWIDNCRKTNGIVKRKGQYYIQTWHAGLAGKKVEKDVIDSLSPGYVKNAKHDSRIADLFLSGSKWESDLYRKSFWYKGEILEKGLPRNDIFFTSSTQIKKKVREFYHLDDDIKIVVYAPTFRQNGDVRCYNIDYTGLLTKLTTAWGGRWVILIRMHPSAIALQNGFQYTEDILNGSVYPEINELIISCDLLISDYSSCMFDAMLINKKIIQYASDIESYKMERGFYFEISSLPFPQACSNIELNNAVDQYDYEKEKEKQNKFLEKNGSVEGGFAAKEVVDRILKLIDS